MSGFVPESFDQAYATFRSNQRVTNATPTPVAPNQGAQVASAPPSQTLLQPGDTLVGKLGSISIYTKASKNAEVLTKLAANEPAVYLGEEVNGLYRVGTNAGEGWADKLLFKRVGE